MKRRTELARGAPLVPRKGLAAGKGLTRKATKPREAAQPRQEPRRNPRVGNQIPQASRDALSARSGGRCEAVLPGICTGVATDAHHRRRRRDGGHGVENLIHLCRADHERIHRQPELARAFGWIVSAWADPAIAPVMLRGNRWVLFTADGTYAESSENGR